MDVTESELPEAELQITSGSVDAGRGMSSLPLAVLVAPSPRVPPSSTWDASECHVDHGRETDRRR